MNHFRHTQHGFFFINHAAAETPPAYGGDDLVGLTPGSVLASKGESVLASAQELGANRMLAVRCAIYNGTFHHVFARYVRFEQQLLGY
jgi:hypothetical protein